MPVPRGLVNVCEPERPRRMGGRDKRDGPAVALMFSAQQTTWFAGCRARHLSEVTANPPCAIFLRHEQQNNTTRSLSKPKRGSARPEVLATPTRTVALVRTRGGNMPVKISRQPRPAIEEAPGRRFSNMINIELCQPVQEKVRNVWPC